MRLAFWRKDKPDEMYLEPRKRPRETLTQTAERIIQRKMKRDPDGYGLEAAEKLKGMRRDSTNPFEAYKEIKGMLTELKEETGTGEGKGMLFQILQALPVIPDLLRELRQMQSQGIQVGTGQPSPQLIPEQPRQQLQQPKPKREKPKPEAKAPLSSLADVLQLTPSEAYEILKAQPGWIELLKNKSPEEIIEIARQFSSHPQYGGAVLGLIQHLESEEGRQWLSDLIDLVRIGGNGGDNA